MTKRTIRAIAFTALLLCGASDLSATPPYGDPNQPYDRLPGTLETPHVAWCRPRAGGKLNVLFIVPYCNSREVIETAQRLDLDYTVIMNATHSSWAVGYSEGQGATPLEGIEGKVRLNELARTRLSLGHTYDAIVIGKVSWPALPDAVRKRVLEHVARGTGLVYVSPNRIEPGYPSKTSEQSDPDPQFAQLFEADGDPSAAPFVLGALPLDILPLRLVAFGEKVRDISGVPRHTWAQSLVRLTATRHGNGRVLSLDYFDETIAQRGDNSLTPFVACSPPARSDEDYPVMYDYAFALLARSVLWAADREPPVTAGIAFEAPATDLNAPVDAELTRYCWENKTPATVIARQDLGGVAHVVLSATLHAAGTQKLSLAHTIRNMRGNVLHREIHPVGTGGKAVATRRIPLPRLPRGTYLVDLRVLDQTDRVLDFSSRSFRVEDALSISSVTTENDRYRDGEAITGTVSFSRPLTAGETVAAWAVDTWGRTTARAPVALSTNRESGTFALPVHRPLSRLWDVHCAVQDAAGPVDETRTWVGIPDWTFDDYTLMLIFCPTPRTGNWKGQLYGNVMRDYGLNAAYTYAIHGDVKQYEVNARYHLQSVTYGTHLGEAERYRKAAGEPLDPSKEESTGDMSELGRMCRHMAETGEFLDPEQFPYRLPQGSHSLGADFLNRMVRIYQQTGRFGSPCYLLTGEEYLLGEFDGNEYSGFAPLATQQFQQWCRQEYGNDLAALNAEWGSALPSWDAVRGILLQAAVETDQLPRWVDFRYFMRSRVWSQFFLDYAAMIRRFVPEARSGKLGHDHHDFSRYRRDMTTCKLYIGQVENSEWREAIIPELYQSFSGDNTYLLASQSTIRWTYDHQTPLNCERWPWKVLFLGLQGFDWENFLAPTLGGMSCLTPDLSEAMPYFKTIAQEVRFLERGIGKLTIAAKPYRSKVAMLWSPRNHYISRLHPFQDNAFSGTWTYNISVTGGAPSDCLALLKSLRIRPTIVAPEDLADGGLRARGFKALVLPYSKGMSQAEAGAIRAFVKAGGLVIADNTPGIYSQHGRELAAPRLNDLFPVFDRPNVVRLGKGHAAYLPNGFNGYIGRFEKGDYTGSDTVAVLLKKYAGIMPPVELRDADGVSRRDTLMPLFERGATRLLGLLRASTSGGRVSERTRMQFEKRYHVWDVREHSYCGHTDALDIRLDLRPRYFALLPANPTSLSVTAPAAPVRQGTDLLLSGRVVFAEGDAAGKALGQAVHIEVFDPAGNEVEPFRANLVFDGAAFECALPISWSEGPGRYTLVAEHVITGQKATAWFEVEE